MSDLENPASFHLYINPGDASAEQVADLLKALSDLHRAAGGNGLRFTVENGGAILVAPRPTTSPDV